MIIYLAVNTELFLIILFLNFLSEINYAKKMSLRIFCFLKLIIFFNVITLLLALGSYIYSFYTWEPEQLGWLFLVDLLLIIFLSPALYYWLYRLRKKQVPISQFFHTDFFKLKPDFIDYYKQNEEKIDLIIGSNNRHIKTKKKIEALYKKLSTKKPLDKQMLKFILSDVIFLYQKRLDPFDKFQYVYLYYHFACLAKIIQEKLREI